MEEFDFSWVEEAKNKAIKYKIDNYYTNEFFVPIDGFRKIETQLIKIRDKIGKGGYITPKRLSELLNISIQTVNKGLKRYYEDGLIDGIFYTRLKERLSYIHIDYKDLKRLISDET